MPPKREYSLPPKRGTLSIWRSDTEPCICMMKESPITTSKLQLPYNIDNYNPNFECESGYGIMLPGDDNDIDPRLAVLVVWGIFFVVFILLPSLCLRCAALCAGPNSRTDLSAQDDIGLAMGAAAFGAGDDYDDQFGWDRYMFLAAAKRRAIDEMRCAVVARYVGRFSRTLEPGEGLMIRREVEMAGAEDGGLEEDSASNAGVEDVSDDGAGNAEAATAPALLTGGGASASQTDEEEAATETKAATYDVPPPRDGRSSPSLHDLAPGSPQAAVDDPLARLPSQEDEARQAAAEKTKEKATTEAETEIGETEVGEGEENAYTHVRLPLPGHDHDGVRPPTKQAPTGPREERGRCRRRWWPRLFPPRAAAAAAAAVPGASGDAALDEGKETKADNAAASVLSRDAWRDVPAFCAICLGEYDPHDTVSWSSNPACTHVFHQDCIYQWLQTLGQKTCKYQRFTDAPTVGMVLNYGLECPCCRQDFILKDLAIEDDGGAVESTATATGRDDNV